jgi:hypothetical protein
MQRLKMPLNLLSFAGVLLASAASIGYILFLRRKQEERISKEYRKRFQSNEEFLRGIKEKIIPDQFALTVRQIVAELARVPSNSIYFADRFEVELSGLPFWNDTDAFEFASKVKAKLGIDLGDDAIIGGNFYKLPSSYSVDDLVCDLWHIASVTVRSY